MYAFKRNKLCLIDEQKRLSMQIAFHENKASTMVCHSIWENCQRYLRQALKSQFFRDIVPNFKRHLKIWILQINVGGWTLYFVERLKVEKIKLQKVFAHFCHCYCYCLQPTCFPFKMFTCSFSDCYKQLFAQKVAFILTTIKLLYPHVKLHQILD